MKKAIVLLSLISLQSVTALAAGDAAKSAVPGWTVEKLEEATQVADTCTATWTNKKPAELAIVAEGPLLTLTVSSSAFSREKREEIIWLRKTGIGKLQRTALVSDAIYGVTIDNEVDSYLEQDGPLILTVKAVDYSFALDNVSSAIDAVRRCAGQPTKAEMQAMRAPAFPVPDGWEALDNVGGCAARLDGDEVDTMLTINDKDQVLLIAGRRDWNSWAGDVSLTLQIDSQPPRSFTGTKWNNLVLLLLPGDKDVAALRNASSLRWHLPTGDYSTKVHDVGSALDAAAACTKRKRVASSK